jgi:hypothetical protein
MADDTDWDDRESPSQSSNPDITRLERLEEESTSSWMHEVSKNGSGQGPADDPSTTNIVNVDTARMPSRNEKRVFSYIDTGRMPNRISRIEHDIEY